jgi:hypothetical protein
MTFTDPRTIEVLFNGFTESHFSSVKKLSLGAALPGTINFVCEGEEGREARKRERGGKGEGKGRERGGELQADYQV